MTDSIKWEDEIININGIGDKKLQRLNNMGIFSFGDMLNHFPYRYKDKRKIIPVLNAFEDKPTLVCGKLQKLQTKSLSKGRTLVECYFIDASCRFSAVFFNMPYLMKSLKQGSNYLMFGHVNRKNGLCFLTNPEIYLCNSSNDRRGLIPVYRCTNGISNNDFIKWIASLLSSEQVCGEWIDSNILEKNNICSRQFAYRNIHFPKGEREYKEAKYRLIYEQLLLYQLALRINKNNNSLNQDDSSISDESIDCYINELPFKLTEGQLDCIKEIEDDLISVKPMNRLIQGDVGCGKTVVAEAAIYKCLKAGYQASFMVPTEILAKQHFARLSGTMEKHGFKTALLISNIKNSEKKKILNSIKNGDIDLVIGTHAIIQEDVEFNNLALVITDEQHRFGVNQRKSLVNKGRAVNVCVMSATPIPRTLAATVFGDMDFSIIKSKPENRLPIITRCLEPECRKRAYIDAKEEVKKGHQVYVIAPSIDSDDNDIYSVEKLFEELKKFFSPYRTEFIHGKLSGDRKEQIMIEFAEGRIDVLIATVVIEVGIDVANASMMIIENSERFGLAQLHQLRGRVGRSNIQSYCYIINYGKSDVSRERASIFSRYNDGFLISEEDYRLRGPGDISGVMQSGNYSGIINLCSYKDILNIALADADYIMEHPGDTKLQFVERYINCPVADDNSSII